MTTGNGAHIIIREPNDETPCIRVNAIKLSLENIFFTPFNMIGGSC